jgi:hypothetical protein
MRPAYPFGPSTSLFLLYFAALIQRVMAHVDNRQTPCFVQIGGSFGGAQQLLENVFPLHVLAGVTVTGLAQSLMAGELDAAVGASVHRNGLTRGYRLESRNELAHAA